MKDNEIFIEYMKSVEDNGSVKCEKTKDGLDIIKISKDGKERYLGSKYTLSKEIQQLLDTGLQGIDEFTTIYLFGLGGGYLLNKLIEATVNSNKIIVVEPEMQIVRNFFQVQGNVDLLNDRVYIIPFEKNYLGTISEMIFENAFNGAKIIEHPGYDQVFLRQLKDFIEMIRNNIRAALLKKNTADFFSEIWFEATVKNIKYLSECISINNFKDIHKNQPAIIVSAGPSLDKNISQLKGIAKNFKIIAGGRTLRPLLENGIIPDYYCIVDSAIESYELVEGIIDKYNIPLVCSEKVPTKVFEEQKGAKIFYSDSKFVGSIVNEALPNISVGGSVAHASTMFAMHCGCNPIVFIGQDLAYTNDKVHAENSEFVQDKHKNLENFNLVKSELDLYVEDIYGNKVRTSMALDEFRRIFEDIIKYNENYTFINATEGGAHIRGTKVMTLREVIENYSGECQTLLDFNSFDKIVNSVKIEDGINKSIKYFKKILKKVPLAIEANEKLFKAIKNNKREIGQYINQLDKFDDLILNKKEDLLFIDYLLNSVIHEVLHNKEFMTSGKETKVEEAEKVYNRSKLLYSSIKVKIEYAMPILEKELSELND